MARKVFATISWTVEDVLDKAEYLDMEIDKKVALKTLIQHENSIMDAMVAAGWEIIEMYLLEQEDEQECTSEA
ncbi:MAG: hypothetical protein PHI18_03085 [bacterium]|nr:hypothetical protein [bacterium]